MNTSNSITSAIRRANEAGRPALVAYLTAGFPQLERFRGNLTAIASAADVVEIGVPFTDPMADGVTIQRASRTALQNGVTLQWILSELEQVKSTVEAPLVIMSYLNPLLAYGMDRLPAAAARAGVAGFIVPDLPYEENAELRGALQTQGIALIQMVTPVTPPGRLKMLCKGSEGFIYAVTATGITGKNVGASDEVTAYLDRVRAVSAIPVCAGFGIRGRNQVERLRAHADGVVVGSALVEVLEKNEDPVVFLKGLTL